MTAAVRHGIRRVINTGPHFTIAGPSYEAFDNDLGPDIPPQPGTNLYGLTKSLGLEMCRVFTDNHDVFASHTNFMQHARPSYHHPGCVTASNRRGLNRPRN